MRIQVLGLKVWGLGFKVEGQGVPHRGRHERRRRQDSGGVDDLLEDRCEPEQRAFPHLHAFNVSVCCFHSLLIFVSGFMFDTSFLILRLIISFFIDSKINSYFSFHSSLIFTLIFFFSICTLS